jgi:hypothetical protein
MTSLLNFIKKLVVGSKVDRGTGTQTNRQEVQDGVYDIAVCVLMKISQSSKTGVSF